MQNLKVEDTYFPSNSTMRVGDKLIDLTVPKVMGILNITPDSFYTNSRVSGETEILKKAEKMLLDGADFLDIGGYSSRPGAENITENEEINRIQPVIESITKHFPESIISLDTFRGEVARIGLESGAKIINDISGFELDPTITAVVAHYKVPYVLMHMKGTPQNMVQQAVYDNIFTEIMAYFSKKIKKLESMGICDIVIDPGFGFSKTMEHSHFLLHHLESFHLLEKPILVGVSRKSMVYKKLGTSAEEALTGTVALNSLAISKGASILRVHDVKEAVQTIKILR